MPAIDCPFCKARSNFSNVHQAGSEVEGRGVVNFGMWRCDNCGRFIVGEVAEGARPHDYYPKYVPDRGLPDVPHPIAEDAKQAFRCFAIGAWRATAAMARRALQAAAYDKGAPKGVLIDQIDWLADNGHITDQMRKVAHRIRLGGNLGAHPDRDGLQDVGEIEARAVLGFLDDFLRYVYEIPAHLARLEAAASEAQPEQ